MKTTVLGLATFLLVSLFFVNATTSISNLAVGEYDPWADLDGDGDIDIFDVVDIAGKYSTTGDSTRNVNITNWIQPKPETLLCVTGFVDWEPHGAHSLRGQTIYVGEYERMSIILDCDNINVEYGEIFWTVEARWSEVYDTVLPHDDYSESLDSTLLKIDMWGNAQQIGMDSYTVKAPYVQLSLCPVDYEEHKGNATISCYVYLSHGSPMESRLQTQSLDTQRWTNEDYEIFGAYLTEGYRQLTVRIWTNVSCYVSIEDNCFITLHSSSKGYGWDAYVIQITVPEIYIRLSLPASKPWYIAIKLYLTM